ncbi:LuxR family transcriptional regulator [Pseudomonas sp. MAFF 730085]|uniref:LuxR family transcriptional regulator n=1 Tax=Pseudomonas kitaguniensis TaxID=2607908 RepID=A0A5N7JXG5_9PSED|nr:LuxR family transcriptional regulator [Pseudomonas kitaguniensis]MPQ86085.1 LuxR family transcriptional regulator [Pseudomonas kitaguniensis]MPR02987.1 LuxR family transcriptional regulator [Pseudomonas kitaguniensis]
MINWRNTKIPKLEGEDKITTIYEMVINHTYQLGFEYCSFTMSPQQPTNPTKPINLNNYPNEWNTLYKQAHFFEIDPIVAHCKRSVMPIVWDEKAFSSTPNLWSLAQSFGVHLGWTQAVHDFQGMFSMLTLGRRTGEVSPEELYEKAGQVMWLCHAMHAVMAQKYAYAPNISAPCKLTPRETEILRWSAMGKTACDIATILCLSERTVGFHISSCLKKLGVSNKIAAVLCASKAGLF